MTEQPAPIVDEASGLAQYALADIGELAGRNAFWLVRECEAATKRGLQYDDDFIDEQSYRRFAKWYNSTYSGAPRHFHPRPPRPKRRFTQTHRVEIAYRTRWRCGMCRKTLTPAFECDHILALHRGGLDRLENAWALCAGCHAEKSRAEALRKDEFLAGRYKKRLLDIEGQAFRSFKRQRESKYFAGGGSTGSDTGSGASGGGGGKKNSSVYMPDRGRPIVRQQQNE